MDGFLLYFYSGMTYMSKSDPHSGLLIERLAVSVRERMVG